MQLRIIKFDDYQKLIEFWKRNYFVSEMDNSKHFLLFLEKNPELSVLMEENGEIIGTALGSYDGRRGYLQKVVTNKESRKKGIGKQLVNEVVKRLKEVGALYIPISVEEELIPFYEKCGFVKKDSVSMSIDL
jgi:N-acetylglutamate synthase